MLPRQDVAGTDIGIGVISAGVATLGTGEAAADLLGRVTVLPGQAGEDGEGAATLATLHELAPGADLYFATGLGGPARFAANVEALCRVGADIIVDDLFDYQETIHQGGLMAQGIHAAIRSGCVYVSTAGRGIEFGVRDGPSAPGRAPIMVDESSATEGSAGVKSGLSGITCVTAANPDLATFCGSTSSPARAAAIVARILQAADGLHNTSPELLRASVTGSALRVEPDVAAGPAVPQMLLDPPESDPMVSVWSEATYNVTFQGTWTTTVTTGGVPTGAHFTTLIGGVHNASVTFLREGGTASPGVELMAELGGTSTLANEVRAAAPNALSVLQGSDSSIGATSSSTISAVTLTTGHPRVTLLSMVAPSPDWFVGVSGLSLLDEDGDWVSSHAVDLYPWDAGTEDGTEFSLSNSATSPQGTITSLRGQGKFSDERIATLTFTLQSVNTAPSFSSDPSFEADENQTAAGTVVAADPDSDDGVSFAISGGADASRFEIGETSGVLSFEIPPNYERAADAASTDPVNDGGNNEYIVTVTATGGTADRALTEQQTITVTVRNLDEAGTVGFSQVGAAIRASLSDPDGGVSSTTWQWARSSDRSMGWVNIGGATSRDYTPSGDDDEMYLRATVSYTDTLGSGKQAQGISTNQISPPDIQVDTLVSGLSIPWGIAFAPDGTMLFTQRRGVLSSRLTDGTVQTVTAELGDLFASGETGLMGIVVDPDFTSNRRFYTCQGHTGPVIQVIAWTIDADYDAATRVADPLVGDIPVTSGRHGGCRLRFGPEGYLWIATGDAASGALPQNLASRGGKVLRVDAATGSGAPGNPFASSPRVYTYGHRNPQGLALRPGTDQMWLVEHGPSRDDEINLLVAGRNYGWDPVPGYNERVSMTDLTRFPNAVEAKWSSGSPTLAVSGGIFLEGDLWGVWEGRLAVAALKNKTLRLFEFTPEGALASQVVVSDLTSTYGRLRTPMLGPDGALYVSTSNGGGTDRILRIGQDTSGPTVSQMEITSDAGTDSTYAIGDEIEVTVTFGEDVLVTGSPELTIKVGDRDRTAEYRSVTGSEVLFRYEVAVGDVDTNGVSIEADSLSVNGGTIKDGSQNDADLNHQALGNNSRHKVEGIRPELAATNGAVVDTATLTLTYTELLDQSSTPPVTAFVVSGGSVSRTVSNVSASGSTVRLTLSPAVNHWETGIQLSYTVPTGMGATPIQDRVGNDANDLSGVAVTNETPDRVAPTVRSIEMTSDPGTDETYAIGDEIEVTVTFDETVEVTGTPRLTLKVGTRDRTANYESVTGAEVLFTYTVAPGDTDSDGVSIEADKLSRGTGRIRDLPGNDADLTHSAVAADSGQKVDGIKPRLAATDGAVASGTMLTLAYSEPLDPSSVPPAGAFTITGGNRTRAVTGVRVSGSAVELTLNPAVEHGETGLRVSYTVPTEAGENPIQDAPGNDADPLSNKSVTNNTGDTTGPVVQTVRFTSSAGSDQTYAVDDFIDVTVTFNETVVVTGTPQLTLNVGGRSRAAEYLSVTGAAVKFVYEVVDGDNDEDGVSIDTNSLYRSGGTIRDGAQNDAALDHSAVAADSRHRVDGIPPGPASFDAAVANGTMLTLAYDEPLRTSPRPATSDFRVTGGSETRSVTRVQVNGSAVHLTLSPAVQDTETGLFLQYEPGRNPIQDLVGNTAYGLASEPVTNNTGDTTGPVVQTVRITSDAGSDQAYAIGEVIEVTVTFSETVVVTGTPRLTLNVGSRTRTANYRRIRDGAVVFEYKVLSGDMAPDGVSLDANRLSSGTIRDGAGNNAVRDHAPVAADSRHKVDGIRPSLAASNGAVANGTTLTLAYGEPLDSSSAPSSDAFMVTGGSETRTVTGVSVSGSAVFLTLSPTVQATESGLRVTYAVPTETGENPVQDRAGNDADRLSNRNVTNRTGDTTGPTVNTVRVTSSAGSDRTYGVGDLIEVTVTFNETVVVTGTPELTLNVGGQSRTAAYRSVANGAVKFAYKVVTDDSDEDGVNIEGNQLSAAGGTIRDGANNDAALDHTAVAASTSHKVDAVAPVLALTDPAVLNGATLTLTYNERLNTSSRPATGDFTVAGGNETRNVTRVQVTGSEVRLTVSPAAEHGETGIRVSYETRSNPIQDLVGNDAEGFTDELVDNRTPDTTNPTIEGVEISSDPGTDETYAIDDMISVTVRFSETVTVDTVRGTPTLDLLVGNRRRRAGAAAGPDRPAVVFTYTVVEGDEDEDGVSVPRGSISLNGGKILDLADNAASRNYEQVDPQPDHKVDGVEPDLESVTVHGSRIALLYDESLDEGSIPSSSDFTVTVEGDDRSVLQVQVSGNTVTLRLASSVAAGEAVTVSYTPGFTPIQDEVGNGVEGLTNERADPPLVTITAREGSEAVTEGTDAEFTLTRGPPTAASLTIGISVTERGSVIDRSGGNEPPEEVTFGAGQETASLAVSTDDDDTGESSGSVVVTLQSADEYRLGPSSTRSARVTVRDNDGGGGGGGGGGTPPPPPPPPPPGGGGGGGGGTAPPPAPAPTAPTAPLNLQAGAGEGEVTLSWEAPESDGRSAITDYEVRVDRTGEWTSTGSTDLTITVADLENGRTYVFEVRAVNEVGPSPPSDPAEATPMAAAPPLPEEVILEFAHFGNGVSGNDVLITSDLVLVNVAEDEVRPVVYFYDRQGELLEAESVVDLGDDLEVQADGGLTVRTALPSLGEMTISSHGRGEVVTGSVRVVSDGTIGGVVRFDIPEIGVAGVGTGQPTGDALFPARRKAGGIRTAAAIHNLGLEAVDVQCRLMKDGRVLEEAEIPLSANGQDARFIEELFTATDTSDFVGSVRCTVPQGERFTGVAVELDSMNRVFTTLPVVQVNPEVTDNQETTLTFAHFANGTSGDGTLITSDLVLVNVAASTARPAIYFYNPDGELLTPESMMDLGDGLLVREDGGLTVRTPLARLGELTITTHGRGEVVTGSVRVVSNGPLGGVLRFDIPGVGVAGVGASRATSDALFPARRRAGAVSTAAAIRNLESERVVVRCWLMSGGEELEREDIALDGHGQYARYIEEVFTGTDTTDFVGSVRCTVLGDGMFTGVAVELDTGNRIFTTLPVVPVQR